MRGDICYRMSTGEMMYLLPHGADFRDEEIRSHRGTETEGQKAMMCEDLP